MREVLDIIYLLYPLALDTQQRSQIPVAKSGFVHVKKDQRRSTTQHSSTLQIDVLTLYRSPKLNMQLLQQQLGTLDIRRRDCRRRLIVIDRGRQCVAALPHQIKRSSSMSIRSKSIGLANPSPSTMPFATSYGQQHCNHRSRRHPVTSVLQAYI